MTAERHNNLTQVYTLLLAVLHLTMAIFVTTRYSRMYHTSGISAAHLGACCVHKVCN